MGQRLMIGAAAAGCHVRGISSADCDFRDASAVAGLFDSVAGVAPVVVFCAVVNKSVENSYSSFQDNVHLARNLQVGIGRTDARGLIFFSSVDVYGSTPQLPIVESSPLRPDSWYGLSKVASEWMLAASHEVACPVTVLRLPGVYGPGDKDRSAIGAMVSSARETGRICVRGTGEWLRDYVHVDDLWPLVERIAQRSRGGVLNVATGASHAVIDIAHMVRETVAPTAEVIRVDGDDSRQFHLSFDASRLASSVPDVRLTTLREGIARYRETARVTTAHTWSGHHS